jgi:hypothetical protein
MAEVNVMGGKITGVGIARDLVKTANAKAVALDDAREIRGWRRAGWV